MVLGLGKKKKEPIKLQKMTVKVFNQKLKEIDKFEVQINPETYSIKLQSPYKKKKLALTDEVAQFSGVKLRTLSMTLHFNTFGSGNKDVRPLVRKFTQISQINSETHKPPLCHLSWGSLAFFATLDTYTESYTMFLEKGTPVRAKLDVTFNEEKVFEKTKKKNSLQSSDRSKERQLMGGDQLWHIADNEYDDPTKWKNIAEANDIDNPRLVKVGTVLKVPSLEE